MIGTKTPKALLTAFTLGIGLALLPKVQAQDTADKTKGDYYWFNIGAGGSWVRGGLGEDDGGISGGISFSHCKGSGLLSIRAVENTQLKLDLWGDSGPPARVWDLGALYGLVLKGRRGLASISGGIGLVGASDDEFSSLRMGIPIECQLFWAPGNLLGVGLYGFANLNSDKSFAGVLLCLQIGKLR